MKKQTVLGILGTLMLGALGSGLWELIKPAFSFAGSLALSVVSLGLDSVVSDIYIRIGHGSALSSLIRAVGLMLMSLVVLMVVLFRRVVPGLRPDTHSQPWLGTLLVLMLLSCGWLGLFGAMRHSYVANERAHFDHLTRIAAPFLSDSQRLAIDSRLARVTKRSDYEKLVLEMRAVIRDNNLTLED